MRKIKLILGFILITFFFALLFLSFKSFWPEEWPEAAQATLAAAITAGIVSILGTYLKFVFDQISSKTEYDQKTSGKMLSKVHTYAEEYYFPLGAYAGSSASQLNKIRLNKKASRIEEKQLALFFITKYFQYVLKLSIKMGGLILLQNFDSELYLEQLNARTRGNLKLTTDQICRLQKSIALEDTPRDFSIEIHGNSELTKIYETFEKWLENNSNVKKTITYFRCYEELMHHELNSIYRSWYQKKAPQISPDCKKVLRIFKKLKKLEEKKDKLSKKKYEEKREAEEENLNGSILGFFKE